MGNTPGLVTGVHDAVAVSAGLYQALALGSDGSLWAWGNNESGQLGTGTTDQPSGAVRVPSLRDVKAIAAGMRSVAMTANGQVWTWGAGYLSPFPLEEEAAPDTSTVHTLHQITIWATALGCGKTTEQIRKAGYICYSAPVRQPHTHYGVMLVGNQRIRFDVDPVTIDGQRYLELRPIAEAAGAKVSWDAATQSILVRTPSRTIALRMGEQVVRVNGSEINLGAAVRKAGDYTIVPAHFFTEAMGLLVHSYPVTGATVMASPASDWRQGMVRRVLSHGKADETQVSVQVEFANGTRDEVALSGIVLADFYSMPEFMTYLRELLTPGTEMLVEPDPTGRDGAGRLLGTIWLLDGRMVQAMLFDRPREVHDYSPVDTTNTAPHAVLFNLMIKHDFHAPPPVPAW